MHMHVVQERPVRPALERESLSDNAGPLQPNPLEKHVPSHACLMAERKQQPSVPTQRRQLGPWGLAVYPQLSKQAVPVPVCALD